MRAKPVQAAEMWIGQVNQTHLFLAKLLSLNV